MALGLPTGIECVPPCFQLVTFFLVADDELTLCSLSLPDSDSLVLLRLLLDRLLCFLLEDLLFDFLDLWFLPFPFPLLRLLCLPELDELLDPELDELLLLEDDLLLLSFLE